nr:zinc finger, CCHC-type [Tanacetum cinerariifolium]
YATKAKELGKTLDESLLVRKLLDSTPNRFIQIVASIEQTSDLNDITLDEITGKLKAFEERIKLRKGGQDESQENLLFAQGEHSGKGRRFNKRGGDASMWYLDNGASNHMTGVKNHFKDIDESVSGRVHFGDGSYVQIKGRGSVLLGCRNQEQKIVWDVYYIPNLKSNILSLGQLTEIGCKVIMDGNKLTLYDKNKRLLMKVERSKNRLYSIRLQIEEPICLLANIENKAWLWHARLGHLNFDDINKMTRKNLVDGIPRINHAGQVCDACLLGKHNRTPFPNLAKFRSKNPLDLVYGDFCGPISPATHSGKKLIFLQQMEMEMRMKLRMLRTDRGGEFTSNEFTKYCKKKGIARQLTAPYLPQQNGVVERRNRTVLSTTRSMMKAMKLPLTFWAEVVRYAIYILNRVPTRALEDKTPYEALYNRKPNLENLRIFGCTAYAKITIPHLKKMDDKSIPLIYLEVEEGSKACRLYDPIAKKKHVSRDVRFRETKPWNWDKDEVDTSTQDTFWTSFVIEEVDNENTTLVNTDINGNDDNINQEPDTIPVPVSPITPPTYTYNPHSDEEVEATTSSIENSKKGFDHVPVRGFKKKCGITELDPTNKDLRNENVVLLREYKEASMDEEKLLRQKEKITWLRGGDFYAAIKEFFLNGKLLREVNATLICLVPKSMTSQKVLDFRPIACCIGTYKCISKILTNRIKVALKVVEENQSAFVLRRAITDSKLPVRYLGVPLVTKKIGVSDCKQLVDKVNQRLNDWKNKKMALLLLGMNRSENRSFTSLFVMPTTRATMVLRNGSLKHSPNIKNIQEIKIKNEIGNVTMKTLCKILIEKKDPVVASMVLGYAIGYNLFHLAIKERQVRVYNLVYQMSSHKAFAASELHGEENALHIAAKLAPSHRLSTITDAAL